MPDEPRKVNPVVWYDEDRDAVTPGKDFRPRPGPEAEAIPVTPIESGEGDSPALPPPARRAPAKD